MMSTLQQVAHLRLHHQHIHTPGLQHPGDVVKHMGALQAQDYDMAKWGIGLRMEKGRETDVENALNEGKLIRSHLLRPTWHIVAAEDYRWILALSAPQLSRVAATYNKQIGLEEATLKNSYKLIAKLLQQQHLTRDEIMQALKKSSIEADTLKAAHIMFHAEINGLVCQGVRRGKQMTYALLDERVAASKPVSRDESLARLAIRYFTSHAPATVHDFSWWSGLSLGDARKAIVLAGAGLNAVEIENKHYYFTQSDLTPKTIEEQIFLLPAFDEFLVGYADRSASLGHLHTRKAITVNGIFKPVVVIDGEVVGLWKRTAKPKHLEIEIFPFTKMKKESALQIQSRFDRYGDYANQSTLKFL